MLTRQNLIIGLIDGLGGRVSRPCLAKQAFLLKENLHPKYAASYYGFVPYQYGPFSFALHHELTSMASDGLLRFPSLRIIEITEAGIRLAQHLSPALARQVQSFRDTYGRYQIDELGDLVQSRYPRYAKPSRQSNYGTARSKYVKPAIYTIGYEGMQIDELFDLLLYSGIRRIIDVRRNAVSRRYGFAGSTLARLTRKIGIEYRHEPQVGIPSQWRRDAQTAYDLNRLFEKYEGELLPGAEDSVNRISEWVSSEPTVLMCMEANPSRCHRSVLALTLQRVTGLGMGDLRWSDGGQISNHPCPNHGYDLSASIGRS